MVRAAPASAALTHAHRAKQVAAPAAFRRAHSVPTAAGPLRARSPAASARAAPERWAQRPARATRTPCAVPWATPARTLRLSQPAPRTGRTASTHLLLRHASTVRAAGVYAAPTAAPRGKPAACRGPWPHARSEATDAGPTGPPPLAGQRRRASELPDPPCA
jgi:hypothetical protein